VPGVAECGYLMICDVIYVTSRSKFPHGQMLGCERGRREGALDV
jgi:hypothetical protein